MIDAMSMMRRISSGLLAFLMLFGGATAGQTGARRRPHRRPQRRGHPAPPPAAPDAPQATPPRVSYINGEVSFWRPGAADWTPATVNTPLAPGDVLYTGPDGNVEIQVGPRAFVRAADGAQLGLDNQEPDFVQFRLRPDTPPSTCASCAAGQTVELATPNAAFTVERTGYYHAEVEEDTTTFRSAPGRHRHDDPGGRRRRRRSPPTSRSSSPAPSRRASRRARRRR